MSAADSVRLPASERVLDPNGVIRRRRRPSRCLAKNPWPLIPSPSRRRRNAVSSPPVFQQRAHRISLAAHERGAGRRKPARPSCTGLGSLLADALDHDLGRRYLLAARRLILALAEVNHHQARADDAPAARPMAATQGTVPPSSLLHMRDLPHKLEFCLPARLFLSGSERLSTSMSSADLLRRWVGAAGVLASFVPMWPKL